MKLRHLATLAACLIAAACTPAQEAVEARIEGKILADFKAGATLPQIELDVAEIINPGSPAVDAAVVAIVDDALAFLVDVGVIPLGMADREHAYRAQLHAQREAMKKPAQP